MSMLARRTVLAALLAAPALLCRPALASGGGGKGAEIYVKLPSVALEFWDADGLFHAVNIEMSAVFTEQASINKKVGVEISRTLSAMAWEEFARGNPAATIKAVALDAVRKDPAGAKCLEVLIIKLIMR